MSDSDIFCLICVSRKGTKKIMKHLAVPTVNGTLWKPETEFLFSQTFSDEATLKNHKQTAHSHDLAEELFECPHCEYKTRHHVYISRHITLKHPVN